MGFFGKQSVGINIADNTIEVVALVKRGNKSKVVSFARTVIIPGIVEDGRIQDEKKLARIILKLFTKAQPQPIKTKHINFALPENRVYSHVFTVESYHKKDNIDNLVYDEAIQNIPMDEDDLIFSHKVVDVDKGEATVLLTAASRQVITDWQQFFKKYLKIEVEKFDVETLANFRGMFTKRPVKPVCVVDIGSATTNIGIFDKKGLQYVHTSYVAGNKLTMRIAKVLNTTKDDAEKRKIRYGLVTKNNEMYSVLARGVNSVFKEIMNAMRYYHQKTGKKIHQVVLLGGSSRLKGLTDYLQTNLNLPVSVGTSSLVKESVPLEYITAIGTAWYSLDKHWQDVDPVIEFSLSQHAKDERERKKKEILAKKEEALNEKNGKKKGKNKPKVIGSDNSIDLGLDVEEAEMDSGDFALDEGSEADRAKKTKIQVVAFGLILTLGIGGVIYSFSYRNKERAAKELAMEERAQTELSEIQTLEIKILAATSEEDYSDDVASARLVRDVIAMDNSYNEALAHSKNNIQKNITEGEVYWPEPLIISSGPENVVYPLTIEWMVYNEKEINQLLVAEVDRLNANDIDYSLSSMEKTTITPAEDDSFYYFNAVVTIATSEPFVVEEKVVVDEGESAEDVEEGVDIEDEAVEEAVDEEEIVEDVVDEEEVVEEIVDNEEVIVDTANSSLIITETGIGYLNVREGAGTSYDIVGQANVGDQFEIVEESGNWYRIILVNGDSGWVINTYVELVAN